MDYMLKEMSGENKQLVLENCDEFERKRLLSKRYFERLEYKPLGWAIDSNKCSYLFRTIARGDPREGSRKDYHFFYAGKFHYITTNGSWPLQIRYKKSEVSAFDVKDFEASLMSAFKVHGIWGSVGKTNEIFNMSILGED